MERDPVKETYHIWYSLLLLASLIAGVCHVTLGRLTSLFSFWKVFAGLSTLISYVFLDAYVSKLKVSEWV